jgi:hypothetical protein
MGIIGSLRTSPLSVSFGWFVITLPTIRRFDDGNDATPGVRGFM